MFIKSLRITNKDGVVRLISFRSGLNLIVDETPIEPTKVTGNNVGKTTVLMLVDFCLGADAKAIYTDPETKKGEYTLVKDFLMDKEVVITLTLVDDLRDPLSRTVVIDRNFLQRKKSIRQINGKQKTADEFEETLTNMLIPNHYGNKPTFSQIISNNIRYKELSITNTLRTLNSFTRDDEYETLHLFLLGCDFEKGATKQNLLASIRMETTFKNRLESKQTRTAYEASLALLLSEIEYLDFKKSTFYINPNFENDLNALDSIKYHISLTGSKISKLKLRKELIMDAVEDIQSGIMDIDTNQLKGLYHEVNTKITNVHKSFESLLEFHNKMVEEKVRYISKELPELLSGIQVEKNKLSDIILKEKELVANINKSGSLDELEGLVNELNIKHRKKGEFETIINQIEQSEKSIENLNKKITTINDKLFSNEFETEVQTQINKFNKYFSSISQELYDEQYALKFDKVTNKTGQKIYKFSSFNTNFSSGKKQGEIVCFDIAYLLFADEENIPCLHFLLNDKKELMHGNQLVKIANLVERHKSQVQYIVSILKDKLPLELNDERNFIVKLSQQEKLFRIENS
ncbi:hypothetical protein BF17_12210 [Yersinia similis]|uniref:DUF2326 domain-containing protein n=1 Tax=Yersinia similis TaxID=367190 RepID=A0ABN4CR43_9GAMM|nr:DUF2326 domain-containing protein [Yersinia similis]AHK19989.1 hypothetical protein BF17_12210 [Yersinia similis]CFQ73513.1 Uncharacterized protein conserved in bacteria (DUF2326) [Yersinia similis]